MMKKCRICATLNGELGTFSTRTGKTAFICTTCFQKIKAASFGQIAEDDEQPGEDNLSEDKEPGQDEDNAAEERAKAARKY